MFLSKLIFSRSYLDVNDVSCNPGDGYFNFQELFQGPQIWTIRSNHDLSEIALTIAKCEKSQTYISRNTKHIDIEY